MSPQSLEILLDECIDWRLGKDLYPHRVKTVPKMGWEDLKNGKLLGKACKQFDVFITVDRNLSFQQHLIDFDIAVIVLSGKSNRLQDLRAHIPSILKKLESPETGRAVLI